MTGQKPSLGRVVLVPMDPDSNNGLDHAPATVVRVWSDTSINVKVSGDNNQPPEWRKSITLVDELPAFDPTKNMHVWCWPPRVGS